MKRDPLTDARGRLRRIPMALLAIASTAPLAGCGARRGETETEDASFSARPEPDEEHDAQQAPDSPGDVIEGGTDDAGDVDEAAAAGHDAAEHAPDASTLGIDCATGPTLGPDGGVLDYPSQLACTGLYANWPARAIAPSAFAYDPGLRLWSDGAEKSRWIYLPPQTQIDSSDMDEWVFPPGTKIWKEFRLNGRRIETRFLWKRGAAAWLRAVYQWSEDESTATAIESGEMNVLGTTYEIPPRDACTTCHMGRIDGVLGFEAVSLASPGASGLNYDALIALDLLTRRPAVRPVIPGAGTPAQAALAWLHANCGTACHNGSPNSLAGPTGLWMRLTVGTIGSVLSTDTYMTAVNVVSNFQPTPTSNMMLIAPGNVANSAIPYRDGTRDTQGEGNQMPPIDTHVVDTAGVTQLRAWIRSLPP